MERRRVLYAEANYGQEEIDAVVQVLKEQRHALVTSKNVEEFEKVVSKLFSKNYGLMVNSGSSANLIAISSLNLEEGSEIITPALTFSTTVAPIVQNRLLPVFVDCDMDNLQIDINAIKSNITKKTKAIMVPNLIGNIPDWKEIYDIAKEYDLVLIEDSADTIGYSINGVKGNRYSDITTSSFYASHIITGAGTGGIVCFNDIQLLNKAKSLRSWGRRSSQYGETEEIERRLSVSLSGFDYDDKYVFDDLGYNFVPSEISAAFALVQCSKLDKNIAIRQRNFQHMKKLFDKHSDKVITFNSIPDIDINWLAFPICLRGDLSGKRKEIQNYLEKSDIQTRTIFTGDITKHPLLKNQKYIAHSSFPNSAKIMRDGLLLGCHNSLEIEDLEYMFFHFEKYLTNNS